MPDTRGRRLKVLAAGLHQVGAKCEKLGGELSAAAVPSFVAASPWQASAGAVNIATAAARKDVAAIAQRVSTRGADYSKAGTAYTAADEKSGGRFRGW
jgi:hypothetical protein